MVICAQFKHLVFFGNVLERRLNRSSIFCPFCLRPKSNPFRCSFKISAWYKSEVIVVGGLADPYKSVQQGLHCLDHGRTDVCTVLARHTSPTLVVRNCPRPTTRQIQIQNTFRHLSPTNCLLLSESRVPYSAFSKFLPPRFSLTSLKARTLYDQLISHA